MQNAAFRTICPIELFTPAASILVTLFLVVNLLARTYFRFRTQVTHKRLEYLPILLSVWTVGKVYAGVNCPGLKVGVLFPVFFVFADTICCIPSMTRVVSGCSIRCALLRLGEGSTWSQLSFCFA